MANHYEIGDIVRYARGSKSTRVDPGSYGTVAAINASENLLTVQQSSGEAITLDPRRLYGVSVYRELERQFSVGDRIQFTAPDKSLRVANRDLAVIESISVHALATWLSRASHEATLFTDNMTKLSPQLSTYVSKSSAVEVIQTQSIGHGIAIL